MLENDWESSASIVQFAVPLLIACTCHLVFFPAPMFFTALKLLFKHENERTVLKCIQNLKQGKYAGPDKIPKGNFERRC